MLLTRSPLSPGPKPWFSLDLHVLSAPPAFVLSQDQTLREGIDCPEGQNGSSFELVLKGHVQNGRDEVVSQPGRATKDRRRTRLSRRSTLLSFQRPSHWTVATKRPLTRTRGPREVDTEVVSARSKALRSSSDRVLVAARLGRLEDGSRRFEGCQRLAVGLNLAQRSRFRTLRIVPERTVASPPGRQRRQVRRAARPATRRRRRRRGRRPARSSGAPRSSRRRTTPRSAAGR